MVDEFPEALRLDIDRNSPSRNEHQFTAYAQYGPGTHL